MGFGTDTKVQAPLVEESHRRSRIKEAEDSPPKEYQPKQRQNYMLPKNIYRQGGKWGYGIEKDGIRYRKFGYATLAEALEGLKLQKERITS